MLRTEIKSVEITNKMQPCNRIYYSKIYWRLHTVFAASGLYTHVVTGRCRAWTAAGHHMCI